jgi:hypothetical protein
MSIVYTADVFCDKCGIWSEGVTVTGAKAPGLASKALKKAKAEGWSRDARSLYTDLCPNCLKEERKA